MWPMLSHRTPASLVLAVLSSLSLIHAQDEPPVQQFRWEFDDATIVPSLDLPTCQPLKINISPFDETIETPGVPPYYMLAFAVGGTPRLYPLGPELEWVVDYPADTRVMLNVVDSQQSTGGIPASLFTSTAGEDTTCVQPEEEQPDFTITANVTESLDTCAPWGVAVNGGAPPYTFSIGALASWVVTNITAPSVEDNTLTYINRALPGGHLLVSASDATGRFASGSILVETTGGDDPTCPGLQTSFGVTEPDDSAGDDNPQNGDSQDEETQDGNSPEEESSSSDSASSNNTKAIAIGVPLGIVGLLAILLGLFLWRRSKRRNAAKPTAYPYSSRGDSHEMSYHSNHQGQGAASTASYTPHPQNAGDQSNVMNIGPNSHGISPFADHHQAPSIPTAYTKSRSPPVAQHSQPSTTAGSGSYYSESSSSTTSPSTNREAHHAIAIGGAANHARTSRTTSTSQSPQKGQPPLGAPTDGTSDSDLQRALSVPSVPSTMTPWSRFESVTSSTQEPYDLNLSRTESGELYVQHRDGGVNVVKELPPPYAGPPTPAPVDLGSR